MNGNQIKNKVIGKILITATITSESPLLIGKGLGDEADTVLMRLPNGRVYIPASSLIGVLRNIYRESVDETEFSDQIETAEAFWGSDDSKKKLTYQSHLSIDDLQPSDKEQKIVIRDGVRIDYKTNIAEKGGKYDYQVLEPGAIFSFYAEVTLREGMDVALIRRLVHFILESLKGNKLRIGALTSFGFGKLSCSDSNVWEFNFKENRDHAEHWFSYLENNLAHSSTKLELDENVVPLKLKVQNSFIVKADFQLKSALITGAYQTDPSKPDKTHLTSNGEPILTGKSLKGAIRHRAVKILNTNGFSSDKFLRDMMGWVDNDQNIDGNAKKSRLLIEEVLLNGVSPMKQNRIRIDRFTGGTMDGALFDSEPVWKNGDNTFTLTFRLDGNKSSKEGQYNNEKALLLFLLKDLWTGDLAIGGEKNIGRGVLQGRNAEIFENDKLIAHFFQNDENGELDFIIGSPQQLNKEYLLLNKPTA